MKKLFLILGIASLVATPVYGLDNADNLSLSKLVNNETPLRLKKRKEIGDFMKAENTLQVGEAPGDKEDDKRPPLEDPYTEPSDSQEDDGFGDACLGLLGDACLDILVDTCLVPIVELIAESVVDLVTFTYDSLYNADNLTLSGLVKNETSLRLQEREERGDFMKVENTFQIGAEYRLVDSVHLFGLFRGFYDALYDIEDDVYDSEYKDEYKELRYPQGDEWLREAYVDLLFDWLDVRIGKQQVVWGTADGIKILDAVNPTDMREFTLDDYRDSRIPLWMLKTEFAPTTSGSLQLLFIPDFEPNYIPPLDSPFTFRATAIGEAKLAEWPFAVSITEEKPDPWKNIDESSFGARWLDVIGGFEYTLNYLYGYYYSGAKYSSITPPGPPGPGSTLNLTTKYERIHLIGGSFSKALTKGPLAGLNIRGEVAYIKDVPGYYGEDGAPEGVVKLDNYNYVLGLDKNLFTNWLFSFQLIQFISSISEHEGSGLLFGPTLAPIDQVETILSLKVATDFMHERLKPEILVLYWIENNWRISPKFNFEISDYLNLAAGAHIFEGDEENLFGQFDDNDQVFFELRYGF